VVVTRVEALINKPLELVFGYVSNFENMPDYNSSVLFAHWKDSQKKICKIKIGVSILNFESNYEILEYKDGELIRAVCNTSQLEFEDKYEFITESKQQTKLIITDSMKLKGILALSEGILKINMKREMEHNMRKLQNILESIVE